ncbi:MAG TPA: polysaccharide pyruvyl transferase family protein, partial [Candidatus Saccharimonadales bacterium]|nr:polysaccharide pyruvyl transferase family protein [Candidatus Saccharimonadales bacterium]
DIARIYQEADLVVPVGGGYIRSREGLMHRFNVPLLLHPLLFGFLLGKPTVLYAQSVGPFQNKFEELLVAFVLKRMTRIMLREDTSVALLAKLGITRTVVRAIDSGFLLGSNQKIDIRKKYSIPPNALLVGVTVRAWLKGEAQTRYEQAVAQALDDVIEKNNAHVIFIPQVTATKGDDDRVVSRRVRGLMQHTKATTLINDTPDHHRIKSLYDSLDLLLGTRFHSVIFSLTSHVPVLAIEYEHKTSGIMRDLGLEQWVIKIEDVDSHTLAAHLSTLVEEAPAYRTYLAKSMPPYVRQARGAATILKKSYEQAV